MDIITSRNNTLVVETAKLKEKKYREKRRAFLFEGIKLTREAISFGVEIEHIFVTERCYKKLKVIIAESQIQWYEVLMAMGFCVIAYMFPNILLISIKSLSIIT